MYPTIEIPLIGITAQSHTVMLFAAVVAALWIMDRSCAAWGPLDARRVRWALLAIALCTFGAGRFHFVVGNWHLFAPRPWRALGAYPGSLHAPGAIVGAAISTVLAVRFMRLPLGRFADALAPASAVGIALARAGCFLQGCCFGDVCRLPWGVAFGPESFIYNYQVTIGILAPGAQRSQPIHPLPVYFALTTLGIALVLFRRRVRTRFDGESALLFLFLFSASSAALEPLRAHREMHATWGSLPQLQWMTLAMTGVSFALLLTAYARVLRRNLDRATAPPRVSRVFG